MKKSWRTAGLWGFFVLSFSLHAQEIPEAAGTPPGSPSVERSASTAEIPRSNIGAGDQIDPFGTEDARTTSKALRFTIGHEASVRSDAQLVDNRSMGRVEYSKLFLESFFVQLDSKVNAYWGADHRAVAEKKSPLIETNTPEAFVQYSAKGGKTSVKVGQQRLIWGESEAGAITDEVSPRNYSELFFIPLEESRLGQFMVNVDHFSELGDWSLFYTPRPKFNKYPKKGTATYHDPFGGNADLREADSGRMQEYGLRWKKTFGRSDISFMGASLIDNDRVLRLEGLDGNGRQQISERIQRFSLAGLTFNYVEGRFLLKGEAAFKSKKAFNDAVLQTVERRVVDSSLGVTYSLGQSNTVALEVVNSHVQAWTEQIASAPRNNTSLVLTVNLFFFNEALAVNWLTIASRPYESYQSSIRTSYEWSDDTTFSLDLHAIDVPDSRNPLFQNRKQDQVFLRAQYKF